jgi:hypothetical protein
MQRAPRGIFDVADEESNPRLWYSVATISCTWTGQLAAITQAFGGTNCLTGLHAATGQQRATDLRLMIATCVAIDARRSAELLLDRSSSTEKPIIALMGSADTSPSRNHMAAARSAKST